MSAYKDKDARINGIKDQIRVVPNFPKPGSFFFSLFLLLRLFDLWENKGHAENEVERNYRLSNIKLFFWNLRITKSVRFLKFYTKCLTY